jgi:hypothetical protein
VVTALATGAALIILGAVRIAQPVPTAALGLLNGALGVWVVVSAFVLQLQIAAPVSWTNNFFLGCAIALLAISQAVSCSFATPSSTASFTRAAHRRLPR